METGTIILIADASWPTFWVQFIYTLVTTLILVVAIWGEWFRYSLAAPKLLVELNDPLGVLVPRDDGTPAWYFHLRVTNRRRCFKAKRAIVVCTAIKREDKKGRIVPELLTDRIPLLWANWNFLGIFRDIRGYDVCDLGHIDKDDGDGFKLEVPFCPNNVRLNLKKDETMYVSLVVESDSCQTAETTFKITYNGEWSDEAGPMFQNLVVSPESPRTET